MAGFFDPTDPTAGGLMGGFSNPNANGLMGMYANPQTAGLLGMAGGLLSASGPSRLPVSMGQAMGAGMQGMQQGAQNAMQVQRQMLQMNALQGLMGMGGAGGQTANPGAPQMPSNGTSSAPLSGVGAGLGGAVPNLSTYTEAPTSAASAGPTIYGRSPQQLFQQGMLMNMAGIQGGGDLMRVAVEHDPTLAMQMPTDAMKMAGAAYGPGTPEYVNAIRGQVDKEGIVPLRPGAPYIRNGQVFGTPPAAPAGFMNQPNADGTWSIVPVAGGTAAVTGSAAAQAGGKAQFELTDVWDPNANGGRGGVVRQTVSNAANAANGTGGQSQPSGLPSPVPGYSPFQNAIRAAESGGRADAANPASSAQGSMQVVNATAANPGYGVTPARDNSPQERARVGADYASALHAKYGNDADAAIAYHYGPQVADQWIAGGRRMDILPSDAPGYLSKVTSASQSYAGGAKPQGGPMASQPPLGTTSAANAAQSASSKQMADSYKGLSDADASYQQSRGALTDMIALAKQMGPLDSTISKLPDGAHNWDSTVASYDKAHATFVSNQYNALSAGTDASKGTVNDMVPSSDKPLDTKIHGLTMQLNNLDYRHLETQLMTPAFQGGDQKGYTTLNAQFHNTVKPEMMPTISPILQMSGPQQQAAVQAAVKANPALRPAFETLFNGGMLR